MFTLPVRPTHFPSFLWITLPITVFLMACAVPPQAASAQDGPEELAREWVEMWNSYDLDEVSRLFLDDPRLTYFSSEKEGAIQGMEPLLDHHRGFGFQPGGDQSRTSRLWVEDLVFQRFGSTAVGTGIWFFQTDPTETASPQRGPVTFVCVSESGRWSFVHMNFSSYLPPEEG